MIAEYDSPASVEDLILHRERSRTAVNTFLETPEVDHKLGDVPGWLAAFGARYKRAMIAVCVLGRPVSRMADDGTEISITRFAARPDRPANTGSWLIARARTWARLEGYETITAHSGVAGNPGTIYKASGFSVISRSEASGLGWTNRPDRDSWGDYDRVKWGYDLQ